MKVIREETGMKQPCRLLKLQHAMAAAALLDELPVELRADAGALRHVDDAVLVDGQQALHRERIILLGDKILKELAVLDGAADVQVDQIHVVHGRGVDLAVEAEGLSKVGNLPQTQIDCLRMLLISSITTIVKHWFDTDLEAEPEEVSMILDRYCSRGVLGFIEDD